MATALADEATMTDEVGRYFFMAGGLPFVVLGVIHALLTPRRVDARSALSPGHPRLAEEMAQTRLRLTRHTDMWLCWVGFNYSHSLGLVVLGGLALIVGSSEPLFRAVGPAVVPFAFLASAMYLVLAIRYWFRAPIIGCSLSCLLFLCSWIL
jgi:hypothetical protein